MFDSPFGKGKMLMGDNRYASAILGGFKFSTIFMAYSGSPLAILATGAYLNTNPASGTSLPFLKPGRFTSARINGRWGSGITAAAPGAITYVDAGAFESSADASAPAPANYMFSTIARTSPLGLQSPANYNLDVSLRRVFGLPFFESAKITIEGDLYNVTNHTLFGSIGTTVGSSNFGQIGGQSNNSRSGQLSGRIEF